MKNNQNMRKTPSNDIYSKSKTKKRNPYRTSPQKRVLNILVIVLSVLFGCIGGGMIYAHSTLSGMYDSVDNSQIDLKALVPFDDTKIDLEALVPSSSDPNVSKNESLPDVEITGNLVKDPLVLNIAIFGSDVRPGYTDYGNSDTILMISIDNRRGKLKLTSFMRDTWVKIPEVNYNAKLNAAYAAGGPRLAMETLEKNFGVEIDRYAVVDFETFPQIIDTLGGVDITLSEEEADYLYNDFPNRTPSFTGGAGTYNLNGAEALDHARNRRVGMYDFERTQRQRDVTMAIVNKFKDTTNVTTIAKLLTQFLPSISTNISVNEMTALAKNSIQYLNYPSSQFRLPTSDNVSDEMDSSWGAILVIDDIDKAREDLARFLYEETVDVIYGTTSSEVPIIK